MGLRRVRRLRPQLAHHRHGRPHRPRDRRHARPGRPGLGSRPAFRCRPHRRRPHPHPPHRKPRRGRTAPQRRHHRGPRHRQRTPARRLPLRRLRHSTTLPRLHRQQGPSQSHHAAEATHHSVTHNRSRPASRPHRQEGANSRAGVRSGTCPTRMTENSARALRQSKSVQGCSFRATSERRGLLRRGIRAVDRREDGGRPHPRTIENCARLGRISESGNIGISGKN